MSNPTKLEMVDKFASMDDVTLAYVNYIYERMRFFERRELAGLSAPSAQAQEPKEQPSVQAQEPNVHPWDRVTPPNDDNPYGWPARQVIQYERRERTRLEKENRELRSKIENLAGLKELLDLL